MIWNARVGKRLDRKGEGGKGGAGRGGEKRGCTKRGRVVENKGIRCRSVFSRGDNTIYRMRVEGNWGGSEVDRSGKK